VKIWRMLILICTAVILSIYLPSIQAQEAKKPEKLDVLAAQLVGVWEIYQTKEPGKPYLTGYHGRPFVTKGPNAFTLILEYRTDGTFKRLSRCAESETVHDGTWKLSGHELRQKRKGSTEDEVMYVRFEGKDLLTSVEVYETGTDPGLFAQFKRVP
jgi:hypothetical protein